jgi:hypothetical protein
MIVSGLQIDDALIERASRGQFPAGFHGLPEAERNKLHAAVEVRRKATLGQKQPLNELPKLSKDPSGSFGQIGHCEQSEPRSESRESWPSVDKRLVEDDKTPAPLLEDTALPAGLACWITKEAAARGCPKDYVAAALIAAGSAWIGNASHIQATATYVEPPHTWMALVGAPSAGKTQALKPIVEASRALELDAEPAYDRAMAEHAGFVEAAKVVKDGWRDAVAKAVKEGREPPKLPPGACEPLEPSRPRVLLMDATTEELQYVLSRQPRGVLYTRDELSGWFGNHDRYGGSGGDRAFFLEAWNGTAYYVDRVKHRGSPLRIPRTSLAMLGGLQPDRLREALGGADDGLAARFAYVWPDAIPVAPLALEHDTGARDRRDMLARASRRLQSLAMDTDSEGEPVPRMLRLDVGALRLFDEFQQQARRRSLDSRGLAAGWHGKSGRALRLALTFELLGFGFGRAEVDPTVISSEAMARACEYCEYLAAMFDRVTGGLAIGQAEADAAIIARHVLAVRPLTVNERDLYRQSGWAWLRDNDRRSGAFRALVNAGWVRQATRSGGGRPQGNWDVSPGLTEGRK